MLLQIITNRMEKTNMFKDRNFIVKIQGEYVTSLIPTREGNLRYFRTSTDMEDANVFKASSLREHSPYATGNLLEKHFGDVGYEIIPVKLMVDYENPIFLEGESVVAKFDPMVEGRVVSTFPYGNHNVRVEVNTVGGKTHVLDLPPHMLAKVHG